MNFDHVLVTTDFSELSKSAFDFASYQAKMSACKLSLVTVLEPFYMPLELQQTIWSPESVRQLKQGYEDKARERLSSLAGEHFHGQEVEAVLLTDESSAANAICEYAKKNTCDLIVIAGHGRGGVGSLLLGSTAQKIISCAPCPVLVVRGSDS